MDRERQSHYRSIVGAVCVITWLAVLTGCSSTTSNNLPQLGAVAGVAGITQGGAGVSGSTATTGKSTDQLAAGGAPHATAGKGAGGKVATSTGTGGKAGTRAATAGKSGGAAGSATGSTPRSGSTCLQAGNGQYTEQGPYKVSRKDDVELASFLPAGTATPTTYSIWYPDPLEANCPHPIVAWGNGTTVTGPDTYDFFNRNGASWGMVVIGSNNSNVGSGEYHKAGIEYLLLENENPQSIFYHKLSTRAGTAGHSQGGMGATVGSAHPNVEAEVCVAGGGAVGAKVAFICLTGTADQVNAMCTATYNAAPGPAFLGDWEGGDHVTTETVAGYLLRDKGTLQMQRLYAAWFRCFLADDPVACAMFKGSPCGICNDEGWANIGSRNM